MPQLRLTVQTITPLLMYGAANKDDRVNKKLRAEPELRASSIRGMLRYWLRAVLGAQYPSSSAVYEKESAILGSTETGSRVRVRVQPSRSLQTAGKLTVLPEQTKGYALLHTGFTPSSEFRITLSTHPLDKSEVLRADSDLLKAVFLMLNMSGLGRRSRRGSGNLRVLEVKGYEGELPLAFVPESRDELKKYLMQITSYVALPTVGMTPPDFPIFAPDTAVILLSEKTHQTYQDAFDELWAISGPYHDKGGIFGDIEKKSEGRKRRASAIHMRVAATGAGYVAQQTILYSGSGAWMEMKGYIDYCQHQGFEAVYGTWGHWA